MDPMASLETGLKAKPAIILVLALAACAPLPVGSFTRLPPPQVRVTPGSWRASGTDAAPLPTALATQAAHARQSDIARVAGDLFGDRLIERIVIPSLRIDSRVVPVGWHVNPESGQPEWDSPAEAVGWMITSAPPGGADGNTVLYGHNNMYTSVFRDLSRLSAGDLIYIYSSTQAWKYQVSEVEIFPVSEGAGDQGKYLSYLEPTPAPRLTLISCWPPVSNTHRVVVIADRKELP
jgi:LPXTG-site transpeptidase (sortase) family protein